MTALALALEDLMLRNSVRQVLLDASSLIRLHGWCREVHALDCIGREVDVEDPRASTYSALGAIRLAAIRQGHARESGDAQRMADRACMAVVAWGDLWNSLPEDDISSCYGESAVVFQWNEQPDMSAAIVANALTAASETAMECPMGD